MRPKQELKIATRPIERVEVRLDSFDFPILLSGLPQIYRATESSQPSGAWHVRAEFRIWILP